MNGVPWWLAVPGLIAVVVAFGFGVLAVWIKWREPTVQARMHAAVKAENARQRAREEVMR